MARIVIRLGDVFVAQLNGNRKKFFQYVGDDLSMMNSRVIRVFREAFPLDVSPDLEFVVGGDVDFYAHVVIRWGLQLGLWQKVGNVKEIGTVNVVFRGSHDVGNPAMKRSLRWYVWNINGPYQEVGKLPPEHFSAEIGIVVSPADILDRMRTGSYDFFYPGY